MCILYVNLRYSNIDMDNKKYNFVSIPTHLHIKYIYKVVQIILNQIGYTVYAHPIGILSHQPLYFSCNMELYALVILICS